MIRHTANEQAELVWHIHPALSEVVLKVFRKLTEPD
jgi:hypothetical protein